MAPFEKHPFQPRDFDINSPSTAFKNVWTSPSNYAFTILLLLGGDVVARALAQLAGGRITPVAFSFGIFNPRFSQNPYITSLLMKVRLGIICDKRNQFGGRGK